MTLPDLRRGERLAAMSRLLTEHPSVLYHLDDFVSLLGVARSSVSEDLAALGRLFSRLGLGRVESLQGPLGGVRYIPDLTAEETRRALLDLCVSVGDASRVLPGGFVYLTDVICSPYWSWKIGAIFAQAMRPAEPTHVLTVETKGIPVSLMTAHALGLPLVIARRDARVTEGPAVSITYVSGTSGRVQAMSLPRRALRAGARALVVDDFMRGGGTAKGLVELAEEFETRVVGICVAVSTAQPAVKRVESYLPLLVLNRVDEASRWIDVEPNLRLAQVRRSPQ